MAAERMKVLPSEEDSSDESSAAESEQSVHVGHRRFLCCMGCLSLLVTLGILSVILLPFVGNATAQGIIHRLSVSFETLDVGNITGDGTFFPHVKARTSVWTPFPAQLLPANVTVRASVGTPASVVVGVVAVPLLELRMFSTVSLDMDVDFHVTNLTAFGEAARHFVASTETFWVIEGMAAVKCWVAGIVPLSFQNVLLRKTVELRGLGGFSQATNPVEMATVAEARGEPDALHLTVVVGLTNPSYVAGRILPPLQFEVQQRDQRLGTATIEDLHLRPGSNLISLKFVLTGNGDAMNAFIAGYIKAEIQPVSVFGSANSSALPFLQSILQGFQATFNFQPPPTEFLHSVEAHIGLMITAHASVYNPLPRAITMGDMDLHVREASHYGKTILHLKTQGTALGVRGQVLAPWNTSVLTFQLSPLEAELGDLSLVVRLMEAARLGSLVVGVRGPVTITVQPSYTMTLDYASNNIVANLTCPLLCA